MFSYHNYSKYRDGLWTTRPDRVVTLLVTLSVDVDGPAARAGWLALVGSATRVDTISRLGSATRVDTIARLGSATRVDTIARLGSAIGTREEVCKPSLRVVFICVRLRRTTYPFVSRTQYDCRLVVCRKENQTVRVRKEKIWVPATVVRHTTNPQSYWVRLHGCH